MDFRDKSLAKLRAALCFRPLLMQKTKKSVAKRFKLTARGKLVRRTPGFRHLLGAKSTKSKRRATRDKLVAEGHARPLKRCLPFGL
jgi:large subunit ribosomal protein L35